MSLPCGIRRWFTAAQGARLPYTVDHVVADGTENQRELRWQIIKVQRANTRQVGPQVPVDPWALDAYESAQVQTGPGWILEKKGTHNIWIRCVPFKYASLAKSCHKSVWSCVKSRLDTF